MSDGVVAINVRYLPTVHRATHYLLTHRKYQEMDVGLNVRYDNYAPWTEAGRLVAGKSKKRITAPITIAISARLRIGSLIGTFTQTFC